jgi:hypothetical protein
MLLQRVGVGPLGEEGGVGGLSGDKCVIEVGSGNGLEEEGVGEGKDAVVIVGAGVVVRAAREGVGAVGSARFVEKSDVVITER